jgi:A/G-specific adenine glycosylase
MKYRKQICILQVTAATKKNQVYRTVNTDIPTIAKFRRLVYGHYRRHGRHDLPWRKTRNPWRILVSEIMLQQTQVERVLPKYTAFIKAFPTAGALARAPLAEVLGVWGGLGYNRRAVYLKRAAAAIVASHRGRIPRSADDLVKLPGVGPATAAAITAFAFNRPAVLIETNIRTVFIHFFFPGRMKVRDNEIVELIRLTLVSREPRRWYYALMDLGAYLKKSGVKVNDRSAHYAKQTPFKGSRRQIRGEIVRMIAKRKTATRQYLLDRLDADDNTLDRLLADLVREGLLQKRGRSFYID